jgi:hypothetical protein
MTATPMVCRREIMVVTVQRVITKMVKMTTNWTLKEGPFFSAEPCRESSGLFFDSFIKTPFIYSAQ